MAMQMYANTYNQYVMPAKIATGSDTRNMWCGIDVLGPLYGVKGVNTTLGGLQALDRIGKLLNCPAVDRPTDVAALGLGTAFSCDYTYNENLGSTKGTYFPGPGNTDYGTTPPAKSKYDPWLSFKRINQVAPCAIVAVDGYNKPYDAPDKNDVRFIDMGDLFKDHRRIGNPHNKQANFLFFDGTVHKIEPWEKNVKSPYTLPLGDSQLKQNPKIEHWMIIAPGVLSSTGNTKPYTADEVWRKGREIPF
jgi:prepilin-type processing-associated H-X9-DG protein